MDSFQVAWKIRLACLMENPKLGLKWNLEFLKLQLDTLYLQSVAWKDQSWIAPKAVLTVCLPLMSAHLKQASLIAQLSKNLPAMKETLVWFLGWEDLLEKGQAAHSSLLGFPCGSAGKESTCNVGDLDLISGLGRSPGEGKGYLLQDSVLQNSMDCIVPGVVKSWTQLSDFHASL